MRTCLLKFRDSMLELKNVRAITQMAMLMALSLILNLFASLQITESLKLSFGFLATAMMGMLFGPSLAGIGAALIDILQAFIKPTGPYFPGFTLTAALSGVIFGLVLYKNQASLPRLILAKALINLLLNLLLNSLFISVLYGSAFWAMLPTRLLKNVAMLPIEVVLLYLLLPNLIRLQKMFSNKKTG